MDYRLGLTDLVNPIPFQGTSEYKLVIAKLTTALKETLYITST
jgi:hypothetical protein